MTQIHTHRISTSSSDQRSLMALTILHIQIPRLNGNSSTKLSGGGKTPFSKPSPIIKKEKPKIHPKVTPLWPVEKAFQSMVRGGSQEDLLQQIEGIAVSEALV